MEDLERKVTAPLPLNLDAAAAYAAAGDAQKNRNKVQRKQGRKEGRVHFAERWKVYLGAGSLAIVLAGQAFGVWDDLREAIFGNDLPPAAPAEVEPTRSETDE